MTHDPSLVELTLRLRTDDPVLRGSVQALAAEPIAFRGLLQLSSLLDELRTSRASTSSEDVR